MIGVRAVSFDATRTLFAPADPGALYASVLARHGIDVSAAELARLIPLVWSELACAARPDRDRFAAHPGGARGFWRHFVERVAELGEVRRPSPFAAAELYERFGTAGAWRVYPDVVPALDRLAARGLTLAVISNWDERLPRLLGALELAPRFAAVVVSAEVGVEKPHGAIFRAALDALELPAAAVVHIGDSRRDDVEGARAAGMFALHLDRAGDGDLESLDELPEALVRAR